MESKAEGKQEHAEKMPDSPFRVVEGVKIPALFEPLCKRPMEEHVARLKTMELNSDDIMLMAFAKSGTHWIWEVASMLLSGKAEYEKRSKEFAMMEATEVEKLESQSSQGS
ncbi:uncharacterized protein LOC143291724 [Babylonia areolata]|uniref:uncharacterized protein LOC143291724 n=1 Tax=Babylonia areolata TaxID=304850 RepID=UPI003FD2889E